MPAHFAFRIIDWNIKNKKAVSEGYLSRNYFYFEGSRRIFLMLMN